MENVLVTQTQIINEILRIGHGDFGIYTDVGLTAVQEEPELFAHLIAWNHIKGEIRDSKAALPVIGLHGQRDDELFENAAAHLCLLDARNLVRACRYYKEVSKTRIAPRGGQWLKRAVENFIRYREASPSWWDRTAVQHRKSLKTLYAMNHIKPSLRAQEVLFNRHFPAGSVFDHINKLHTMSAQEAAGTILNKKIPFLVAVGALSTVKDKSDIVLALLENMSPAELINNSNMLKRWGVMENPVLKSAYEEALARPKKKVKASTAKTTVAIAAAKKAGNKKLAEKLETVQEEQIAKTEGIEGDWLVLADRSGSMHEAIGVAQSVSATLAHRVRGKVYLIFFNTSPTYFDVTGKTFEEIKTETKRMYAGGGTSVGCGLDFIADKNILVQGIAICSDGGDNTHPKFNDSYKRYASKMGIDPTVYLYHVPGERDKLSPLCDHDRIMVEKFELGHNVDYYSLPQLVLTMRTSRFALADEIMGSKLLTFNEVFKQKH